MITKHVSSRRFKIWSAVFSVLFLGQLVLAFPLFFWGQSLFPFGGFFVLAIHVAFIYSWQYIDRHSSHVPDPRCDGYSNRVKQPYWFDIMVHAIRTNRSPLDSPDDMDIMFSPLSPDPDQFRAWINSGAWCEVLALADQHKQNPYCTADRLRFTSWLLREVEKFPRLLEEIDNPNALQPSEGEQDVDPNA